MALYTKILESRIFDSQKEATDWAKEKKSEYVAADTPVKTDTVPADATRRRWKSIVYLKT